MSRRFLKKTRTTSLRPQSDGMVEKFNVTIESMLAIFFSENQKDWDEYIFLLMMVYRAAVHETTTKGSHYEMMFGRTINLPIYLVIGHPASNNIVPEFSSGYVFSSSKKLEKIHEFARKHIALSSNNMKRLTVV